MNSFNFRFLSMSSELSIHFANYAIMYPNLNYMESCSWTHIIKWSRVIHACILKWWNWQRFFEFKLPFLWYIQHLLSLDSPQISSLFLKMHVCFCWTIEWLVSTWNSYELGFRNRWMKFCFKIILGVWKGFLNLRILWVCDSYSKYKSEPL